MNECDAIVHYSLKYEKGTLKKIKNLAALCLCAITAAVLFCVQPFSVLFYRHRRIKLLQQIAEDKKLLGSDSSRVAGLIDSFVKKDSLFKNLKKEDVTDAKDVAMATYAVTNSHLAPVLLDWTKSLFIRAKEENLRLVFMARDGLGPYKMARILQKEKPEFASIPVSYVYLSRKVVAGSKEKLSRYLLQEGISPDALKNNQRFLFVDIGFLGSMIPTIRKALSDIGVPSDPESVENKVDFEFCVSTGKGAHGFVGNLRSVLPSVTSAGQNRGVYWIEDTHQGVIESPSELIIGANGKLVPNSVEKGISCKDSNELDYLCKKVALEALKDKSRADVAISVDFSRKYNVVSGPLRESLDKFLRLVKTDRVLYVDHK
jgi:hypothetical protein